MTWEWCALLSVMIVVVYKCIEVLVEHSNRRADRAVKEFSYARISHVEDKVREFEQRLVAAQAANAHVDKLAEEMKAFMSKSNLAQGLRGQAQAR